MQKHVIHLLKDTKNNTRCGRYSKIFSTNHIEYVTCKKCLGYFNNIEKNMKKRHLSVQKCGRDYKYYNSACHTIGGNETHDPMQVTCKKCIHIINKSLSLCQ